MSDTELPTIAAVYAFLREHYRRERFEDSPHRSGPGGFSDYPQLLARSAREELAETGRGFISRHESRTGRAFFYDVRLRILPPLT